MTMPTNIAAPTDRPTRCPTPISAIEKLVETPVAPAPTLKLRAASAARDIGATSWALTGAGPNPLTEVADDAICLDAPSPHVQECQLAAIHALCEVFDGVVRGQEERRGTR